METIPAKPLTDQLPALAPAHGWAPSFDIAINLLRVATCPNCDGSGAVMRQVSCRQYVSRDMAIDAGDLSMEGSIYREEEFEPEQCQWCYERDALISSQNSYTGD